MTKLYNQLTRAIYEATRMVEPRSTSTNLKALELMVGTKKTFALRFYELAPKERENLWRHYQVASSFYDDQMRAIRIREFDDLQDDLRLMRERMKP